MEYLLTKDSLNKKMEFSSSISFDVIDISLKFKSDVIEFSRPKLKLYQNTVYGY